VVLANEEGDDMNKDCKVVSGTIDSVVSRPPVPVFPAIPSVGLDYEQAVGFRIGDHIAIFVPMAGLLGPCGDKGHLLRAPTTMGIVINCEKEVWVVETEPTEGNRFGMIIYTARRKPIISGQGAVTTSDGATNTDTVLEFKFATLYDMITSSPKKTKVSGGGKVGSGGWEVTGTYTIEF